MAHANTKNLSNIPVILNARLNRIKNYCPRRANTSNPEYVKCTNKKRNCFVPIKFCLLNTRSINKKELILKDFTVENDIDIFAVTETWLRDDNTFSLADVCRRGSRPWRKWLEPRSGFFHFGIFCINLFEVIRLNILRFTLYSYNNNNLGNFTSYFF